MKINRLTSKIYYKKNIIKAKIINVKGSSPNKINDFMLVATKDIFGTIGGGNLEYLVIEESKLMLKNKLKRKKLNIPLGPGIGQCCGGYVEILLTLHKNTDSAIKDEKTNDSFEEDLYIFGAGHIGQALIETISNLNFNTYLIDSREEYLKMSVNKNVNYLLSKEPWKVVNKLKDNSYYVVLTHSHEYDLKILNEVLTKKFSFVGLIGSTTKKQRFFKRLTENGHDKNIIKKIECPIGVDIGNSKDPNEIAFSIITRLIYLKNQKKKYDLKNTKVAI
tara:strand:+ start:484 stop:1314 length:831 start_codon:yes stop_codon:yes gene_type:complete